MSMPALGSGGPPPPPQQQVWAMHPQHTDPNREFKAHYDMKEELGKGGFGTVRRCIYKPPQGQAKKELAAKINNTPEKKDAQLREATVCLRLSETVADNPSPNPSKFIVNLFDTITEGDIVYNIYEMASGGDLHDEITRKEFFQPDEAALAICQILRGVNHIHQRGYLHIDLKPQNVLIQSKSCRIYKVADFGLAVQRREDPANPGTFKVHTHGNAGTPAFKPPEAYQGQAYDTDFDIWSCGVILYQMLAGYQPFWEEQQVDMEAKIKAIDFEFPSPEWDGLTEARDMIKLMLCAQIDRAKYELLQTLPFHQRGMHQPLPKEPTVDVKAIFDRRREEKKAILQNYWAAQQQQIAQGGQPPLQPPPQPPMPHPEGPPPPPPPF